MKTLTGFADERSSICS